MMPDPSPAAQITYSTSPFLSPTVIGGLVTLIASIASGFGVHILDDPQMQQTLVVVIGLIGTGLARYMWPQNDGRLSFAAPLSTPAPQNLPTGASVINVPAPEDKLQVADVQPLEIGTNLVNVSAPAPAAAAMPSAPTVVVIPAA